MHSFRIAAMLAGIATGECLANSPSRTPPARALLPAADRLLPAGWGGCVGVSIALLALLPPSAASRPDGPRSGWPGAPPGVRMVVSLLSALLLVWLISAGFWAAGSAGKTGWFWLLGGILDGAGDRAGLVWQSLGLAVAFNGIGRLFERGFGWRGFLRLPGWLGGMACGFSAAGFSGFTLADPARMIRPDWPGCLSAAVFSLWPGWVCSGARSWLARVEFFTVLMRQFVRLAPLVGQGRFWRLDWPAAFVPTSQAVARPVSLLRCAARAGSFDGFNETFSGWI